MKIAYLVDTSYATPLEANKELAKRVHVVPFVITSPDKKEYFTNEITIDDIQKMMEKFPKEGFKTSLTPAGILQEKIEKLLEEYDYVIGIPIAKSISNQYSSFFRMTNEEKFKGKFFTVGTRNCTFVSYYETMQLDKILMTKKVLTEEIINKAVEETKSTVSGMSSILISSFDRLVMSGRISKVKGKIGDFLGVKANVRIEEDGLRPAEKGRSTLRVLKETIDKNVTDLSNLIKKGSTHLFVMPYGVKDDLKKQIIEFLKETYKDLKLEISEFPKVVSIHLGIGAIAVSIVRTKL